MYRIYSSRSVHRVLKDVFLAHYSCGKISIAALAQSSTCRNGVAYKSLGSLRWLVQIAKEMLDAKSCIVGFPYPEQIVTVCRAPSARASWCQGPLASPRYVHHPSHLRLHSRWESVVIR